jgi:hypothetical protein
LKKIDGAKICWRRTDDKMKMINFNFKIMDYNSNEMASLHDLEIISQEMRDI